MRWSCLSIRSIWCRAAARCWWSRLTASAPASRLCARFTIAVAISRTRISWAAYLGEIFSCSGVLKTARGRRECVCGSRLIPGANGTAHVEAIAPVVSSTLTAIRHWRIGPAGIRAIRERTSLSQSEFASLIGVSVKTLQNWEQDRRRPTGPAAALLRIIAQEPRLAMKAIHQTQVPARPAG